MRATARSMASARKLRSQLSLPEMLLWRLLRLSRRKLRFRKQHPIGPFIADFYCPAAKIVIEIDGAIHDQRGDADGRRDATWHRSGSGFSGFPRLTYSPIPRQSPTASIACARPSQAPPPLSLAAERSPSPLLRNGAVHDIQLPILNLPPNR